MLIYAIVFINLAFVFYTIGVWGEKLQRILKPWHLIFFWGGLVCDTIGTLSMEAVAHQLQGAATSLGFHGITGIIAIALMLIHTLWATAVLWKRDKNTMQKFHKFSIIVWLVWCIPFISGAVFSMMK